jgi:hypothetical protein
MARVGRRANEAIFEAASLLAIGHAFPPGHLSGLLPRSSPFTPPVLPGGSGVLRPFLRLQQAHYIDDNDFEAASTKNSNL